MERLHFVCVLFSLIECADVSFSLSFLRFLSPSLPLKVGVGFWSSFFFRHTIDSKFSDFSIEFTEEFQRVTKSDRIEKINFPKKGISLLPPIENPSPFRTVTSVTLTDNHLTHLPIPLLRACMGLCELDLSDNFISSLSQEV